VVVKANFVVPAYRGRRKKKEKENAEARRAQNSCREEKPRKAT
jgi:hypothetical protein